MTHASTTSTTRKELCRVCLAICFDDNFQGAVSAASPAASLKARHR